MQQEECVHEKGNFKNFEGLQVKHKESVVKFYLFFGLWSGA